MSKFYKVILLCVALVGCNTGVSNVDFNGRARVYGAGVNPFADGGAGLLIDTEVFRGNNLEGSVKNIMVFPRNDGFSVSYDTPLLSEVKSLSALNYVKSVSLLCFGKKEVGDTDVDVFLERDLLCLTNALNPVSVVLRGGYLASNGYEQVELTQNNKYEETGYRFAIVKDREYSFVIWSEHRFKKDEEVEEIVLLENTVFTFIGG